MRRRLLRIYPGRHLLLTPTVRLLRSGVIGILSSILHLGNVVRHVCWMVIDPAVSSVGQLLSMARPTYR